MTIKITGTGEDNDLALVDADRKYRAPALEKGLDILELLARAQEPMTTSQMATTLGRSVSELFRMVLALEYRGYIMQNTQGRDGYVLTNKLFTLGISQGAVKNLLDAAAPAMKQLSAVLGQSCHLIVPSGDQVAVVARHESAMDLGFSMRVGYRRQLLQTNSGALLYGFSPNDVKEDWLRRLGQGASASVIEAFLDRALVALEQGYTASDSEYVHGVVEYCVPIRARQGALAVVVVPYIQIRGQNWTHEQIVSHMMDCCAQIADTLMEGI